nr:MAG TPA: hypothetical protein [Bacteriophage sp.]
MCFLRPCRSCRSCRYRRQFFRRACRYRNRGGFNMGWHKKT